MIALATVMGTFTSLGTQYIQDFADATGNKGIEDLYQIPNKLAYFNSVFNVFWITRSFNQQAASLAFPTQTLWIVSVIFEQSYTLVFSS